MSHIETIGEDDRHPEQQPGHLAGRVAERDQPAAREPEEHSAEGDERRDGREQREGEAERARDEIADVLGDALVGVVDLGSAQLSLGVRLPPDPPPEVVPGEHPPPADLEQLADVDPEGRDEDREQR